jgi:hypothetical protein
LKRTPVYIKDASPLPRNTRFSSSEKPARPEQTITSFVEADPGDDLPALFQSQFPTQPSASADGRRTAKTCLRKLALLYSSLATRKMPQVTFHPLTRVVKKLVAARVLLNKADSSF